MRIKRIAFAPEMILDLFTTSDQMDISCVGLPTGCAYRGMIMDPTTGELVLFIEHESFEDIPPKSAPPLLQGEFTVKPKKKLIVEI